MSTNALALSLSSRQTEINEPVPEMWVIVRAAKFLWLFAYIHSVTKLSKTFTEEGQKEKLDRVGPGDNRPLND